MVANELGHAVARPEQQGDGAVAAGELQRACGRGAALLGRNDQSGLLAGLDRAGRRYHRRGSGTLRMRHIHRGDVIAEQQRLLDDTAVEPIVERRRRRGKIQHPDVVTLTRAQAIARRLDRHGDRILVPIADGALRFGLGLQGRIGPAIGIDDRLAAQSQPRDIAAERTDTHHGWPP
jgi:hypothetical protein